ncbi:MAG: hypothetical protein F6K36_25175 [Symploca sp. SIO3C6]|nr:hypothetical protein [Symploca sp. SIO3C6]
MKNQRLSFFLNKGKCFFVVILILGIFFRLVDLDKKFFWGDEVYSSIRIAGYTKEEVIEQVYDSGVISVKALDKYKFPNQERDLTDTINALRGNSEHPPLYYLMARFWMQWFGNSVTVLRSVSALISLLAFPGIYWLCWELFYEGRGPEVRGQRDYSEIAVAIFAISPLHILYAHEAREYSLWTVAILLSSAALLRAIRIKTKTSWGIYAATLTLGFYSHLLFALTAIGHGIYVLATESWRWSKTLRFYLLSTLMGIITYAPWLLVIISDFYKFHGTIAEGPEKTSLSSLIERWFRNINRVFFDANLGSVNVILVILIAYAIYFLCRHSQRRVWLFILSLIGVTAVTLMLPDLILGSTRSLGMRYLIPCYLGIQLAVAYLLVTQISLSTNWLQKFWKILTVIIISAGVLACVINSQKEVSWSKSDEKAKQFLQVAQNINQANLPMVISNADPIYVLTLSYRLEDKVKIQLINKLKSLKIKDGFSDLFVFNPTDKLKQELVSTKNYQLQPVVQRKSIQLWQVLNKNTFNWHLEGEGEMGGWGDGETGREQLGINKR